MTRRGFLGGTDMPTNRSSHWEANKALLSAAERVIRAAEEERGRAIVPDHLIKELAACVDWRRKQLADKAEFYGVEPT